MKKAIEFLVTGIACCLLMVFITVTLWYAFEKNCGGYLKLAGDAPNIEKADAFLSKALDYIEKEKLTSGNSALIFQTPTDDLENWHGQIKGAKETTAKLIKKANENPASVSQLDRDNALMKIREVVLDNSQSGVVVTAPSHISWYPMQWMVVIGWIISGLVAGYGAILLFIRLK